jgi:ParB family transcriptional regulator, chromosome partitioning protein
MSKRTERITSLFSAPQPDVLAADNNAVLLPRVSSGSVRSLKDSFSGFERENEELREQIAKGTMIVSLDPDLIDPSPFKDRFKDLDGSTFDALKTSISQKGQEVPILVREHPTLPGRYQSAYGHRRVRAAKELALPVKAIVRALTDEHLVVAQGLENSAREDLSFIERAMFAMRLDDAGYARTIIQEALTIDRAEVSKMLSIGRSVPMDVVEAIGRAPKVGRQRWVALGEAMKGAGALKRVKAALARQDFEPLASDARFLRVLAAANKEASSDVPAKPVRRRVTSGGGEEIARLVESDREIRVSIDRKMQEGFAAFLIDQLPELFDRYRRTEKEEDSSGG